MPPKTAIEAARKLGLNEYEARAYAALAEAGVSTASAISSAASIPRARVYDVLDGISKKGFAAAKPERPVRYEALPIATALRSMERQKREALEAELADLAAMKGALERALKPAHGAQGKAAAAEGAWLIKGRARIYEKIAAQIAGSRTSVVISTTRQGAKRKQVAFGRKLADAKQRGARVAWAGRSGARFLVFDRNSLVLFLSSETAAEDSEKALLITSGQLAGFFANSIRK